MKKDIRYGGYSANRSDHDSEDGELAVSMGLLNEEGQLRHVLEPKELAVMPDGYEIVYIHKTTTYTHYIVKYGDSTRNQLYWFDASVITEAATLPVIVSEQTDLHEINHYYRALAPNSRWFPIGIHNVNSVGNTLVVMADDGMHYILWKADDVLYNYLGQKPPSIEISFGLSENKDALYEGVIAANTTGGFQYSSDAQSPVCEGIMDIQNFSNIELSTDRRKLLYKNALWESLNNMLWAMINKSNSVVTKDGHFYAPFYVRYCYRMYDGSMWMHSAPVFIPVSSPDEFHITFFIDDDGHHLSPFYVDGTGHIVLSSDYILATFFHYLYWPNNVALTFKLPNNGTEENPQNDALAELKNTWGDIVKSVDIFVSQPLVRENDLERITTMSVRDNVFTLRDGYLAKWVPSVTYNGETATAPKILFDIPMLSEEAYLDKINSVSTFYKVASYSLEDDSFPISEYQEVNIDKSVLSTLATQEAMTDDYKSHNILLPLFDENYKNITSLYNYNNRLNVAAMRERLFKGFSMQEMVPYATTSSIDIACLSVTLATEEGERKVVHNFDTPQSVPSALVCNMPLFYPDSRAVSMDIYFWVYPPGRQEDPELMYFTRKMYSHPMLNGATTRSHLIKSLTVSLRVSAAQELPVANDIMNLASKIYTSEIENPFFFPATGINTVGNGIIRSICAAAKAMSQGQFGQFPLYAFTTEGVWALTVSSEGTYTAMHPVTRDVVLDSESIAQIDTAVLYATERGIMVISGSESRCITDTLLSEEKFRLQDLPHLQHLLPSGTPTDIKPFQEFLQGCRMAYDYLNQRIYVFNPTTSNSAALYPYAYIFSLKSKLWGMATSNLVQPLNSYPEALVLTKDNIMVSLSDSVEGTTGHPVRESVLVTRPLKLGDGNALKSIHTMVQRGMFHKGNVKCLLYASRDCWNWQLIGSSTDEWIRHLRGTGFKWFRIALLATLPQGESISGATIDFELRQQNRLH